jgi:hypothetical protein
MQDVSNITRTTILGRVMEHTLQRIADLEKARARSVKYLINTFTNFFSTYRTPQHHYTLNETLEIPYNVSPINGTAAICVCNQGYGIAPYGEDFYGGFRVILELT